MLHMSDSIKMLASNMVSRKRAGIDPYILFLGAGASISSGCSSMLQIVDDVLRNDYDFEKCKHDIEEATKINKEFGIFLASKKIKEKRTNFFEKWDSFEYSTRFLLLKKHLGENKTPSEGYKCLAQLIKCGFIKTVFSINLDNLLEKSLNNEGLCQSESFVVVVNGKDRPEEIVEQLSYSYFQIKIFKLHGSLESPRSYAFTPKEISDFENAIKPTLSKFINQSLIIIGYGGQDRDIKELFTEEGREIYFVNPVTPDTESEIFKILVARSKGKIIDGDDGCFDTFFKKLLLYIKCEEEIFNFSNSSLSVNNLPMKLTQELALVRSAPYNGNIIAQIINDINIAMEKLGQFLEYEATIPDPFLCNDISDFNTRVNSGMKRSREIRAKYIREISPYVGNAVIKCRSILEESDEIIKELDDRHLPESAAVNNLGREEMYYILQKLKTKLSMW